VEPKPIFVGIGTLGAAAPAKKLSKKFGITPQNVADKAKRCFDLNDRSNTKKGEHFAPPYLFLLFWYCWRLSLAEASRAWYTPPFQISAAALKKWRRAIRMSCSVSKVVSCNVPASPFKQQH